MRQVGALTVPLAARTRMGMTRVDVAMDSFAATDNETVVAAFRFRASSRDQAQELAKVLYVLLRSRLCADWVVRGCIMYRGSSARVWRVGARVGCGTCGASPDWYRGLQEHSHVPVRSQVLPFGKGGGRLLESGPRSDTPYPIPHTPGGGGFQKAKGTRTALQKTGSVRPPNRTAPLTGQSKRRVCRPPGKTEDSGAVARNVCRVVRVTTPEKGAGCSYVRPDGICTEWAIRFL